MNLRHMLFAAASCIALVGATAFSQNGGMNGNSQDGRTDTTMGGSDGGMNRSMDSTMIKGTIESVNSSDSSIVIKSDTTTDTVYYNAQTKMRLPKENLAKGEKVIVKYRMENDKKVANLIVAASKKASKKAPKKADTSKTPGSDTTKQY